ncbi:phosphatase PAP2 family protein [Pontibacter liquoris]|uniref:phosphatase PAP2 family protein n=1 Tax=Pontibacter liquoris TaxID=2905677 RepID=UPI001FA73E2F|nr:phosphatase PAP2 family protein [Pontibacter liquoris]
MVEALEKLDKELFIYINGLHSTFWDGFMIFMSEKLVWIPFYLAIIGYLVFRYRRQSIPMLLLVLTAIGLSDFIASGIFKPYFTRLRPCHDPELAAVINIVKGCGGQFGFMSSHAATTFALAVFFNLVLPDRYLLFKIVLVTWAVLICYSRVYLGVHYPTDVLAGALVGTLMAYLAALGYRYLVNKFPYFYR